GGGRLVKAKADGRTIVRNNVEVEICLLSPGLGRPEDLALPGGGGAEAGVEFAEQVAVDVAAAVRADDGPVGYEAQRDQVRGGPGGAGHGVRHETRFQLFHPRPVSRRRPPLAPRAFAGKVLWKPGHSRLLAIVVDRKKDAEREDAGLWRRPGR